MLKPILSVIVLVLLAILVALNVITYFQAFWVSIGWCLVDYVIAIYEHRKRARIPGSS